MTDSKLVGVLYGGYPQPWHEPFTQRLAGSYEVDARYARGQWGEHIQGLADDLIERHVDVLVTMDTPAMDAAIHATGTIPTVSLVCRIGIGQNALHPEGNLTGLVNKEIDTSRQLRMLVELLQSNGKPISPIAVLYNRGNRAMHEEIREIEAAAALMNPAPVIRALTVEGPDYDFEGAFAQFGDAKALVVLEEPVTVQHRQDIVHFAKQHGVPGMYETRSFLDEGGLLCYGPDRAFMYLRMADYVRRIAENDLRPGNLPPMEEVEPALYLNSEAATKLGINHVPQMLDGVAWAS